MSAEGLKVGKMIDPDVAATNPKTPQVGENYVLTDKFEYDNTIVRNFAIAMMGWAIVGFLVGLIVALKLVWPNFLGGLPELSYGRLRPLHTNSVIFAFVGNAIFMGVYYSLQRLCKARMYSDLLSKIHFWGWQLIIVAAAITLPLGITTSKEYAELEWPIDIAITVVWVIFGWNMFGTIFKRREKHMYVAIWFYIAHFYGCGVAYRKFFELPVSFSKVTRCMQVFRMRWCNGGTATMRLHFSNHAIFGADVLFPPKSCKPSGLLISTFNYSLLGVDIPLYLGWSAPFIIYCFAGLGAVTWSGVLHHVACSELGRYDEWLLTLRGAWDKVREDPVLKFMVVAITATVWQLLKGRCFH